MEKKFTCGIFMEENQDAICAGCGKTFTSTELKNYNFCSDCGTLIPSD